MDNQQDKTSLGTILVIDDSLTVRKLVSLTLERRGYTVDMAKDGLEALSKINERLPDLIFLDITMPRMDGYQLCKIIRNNNQTSKIPVVMLSAKDGFFDKMKGKMVGASDYLTKPFDAGVLLKAISKHLKA
ncbi:MAG: response regulator [Desulfobulbaceae bacterium]|nr:response regulator [Desulfobulbaceae bacterium]